MPHFKIIQKSTTNRGREVTDRGRHSGGGRMRRRESEGEREIRRKIERRERKRGGERGAERGGV